MAIDPDVDRTAFNKDEKYAAQFCGVSVESIRRYRKLGIGPEFRRIGGGRLIKYSIRSLQWWLESQPKGGQAA